MVSLPTLFKSGDIHTYAGRKICSLFTYTEFRRLYPRLGHPRANKLFNLLTRAKLSVLDGNTRQILLKTEWLCFPSQNYNQRLRWLRLTLREDVYFNHSIYFDIVYIDNKPILHVVDEATRFQAARWLLTPSLCLKRRGKLKHDTTGLSSRRAL